MAPIRLRRADRGGNQGIRVCTEKDLSNTCIPLLEMQTGDAGHDVVELLHKDALIVGEVVLVADGEAVELSEGSEPVVDTCKKCRGYYAKMTGDCDIANLGELSRWQPMPQ